MRRLIRPFVTTDSEGDRRHPLQPRNWSSGSNRARLEGVEAFLQGKTVLDLGCASGHWRPDWLHAAVVSMAKEAVGVDLDRVAVDQIRSKGYALVVGDAQDLHLDERFEVVFAGELIEHLDNLRGFLRSAEQHLSSTGMLVVTTPNAFSFSNFVYRLWGTPRINGDHVCWFCEDTLRQLLERHNWEVVSAGYVPHETPGHGRRLLARTIRALLPERLRWGTLFAVARPGRGNQGQD